MDTFKDEYPDVPEELWMLIKVWDAVAMLAPLRLVERALEAQELEKQFYLREDIR